MKIANINTDLKFKAPIVSEFSNASGPYPGDFDLNRYNTITSQWTNQIPYIQNETAARERLNKLNNVLIPEVQAYISKYQNKADNETRPVNKAIFLSWVQTATSVKNDFLGLIELLRLRIKVLNPRGTRTQNEVTAEEMYANPLSISNNIENILSNTPIGGTRTQNETVIGTAHVPGSDSSNTESGTKEKKPFSEIIKDLPKALFYSRETGKISPIKIGGVLLVATALGFGIKFLVKKVTKPA